MKKLRTIITLVLSCLLIGVVVKFVVLKLRSNQNNITSGMVADSVEVYRQKTLELADSLKLHTEKWIQYETAYVLTADSILYYRATRRDSAIPDAIRQRILDTLQTVLGRQPEIVRKN